MSGSKSHHHSAAFAIATDDIDIGYMFIIPMDKASLDAIEDFIRNMVRTVNYTDANVQDKLKRTPKKQSNGVHPAILEEFETIKEFRQLMLDIYENAVTVLAAKALDSVNDMHNPELIGRLEDMGKGLLTSAHEMAEGNPLLELGLARLVDGCAALEETHSAIVRKITDELAEDKLLLGIYFSLSERMIRGYAVPRVWEEKLCS